MSIPSAALTLTVNGVPLKVLPFPNAVAIFNLDLEPDGSKTNYSANMDTSFGAGRARFEFGQSSNIIPGPGTASGNIYILPIPGYKVISAPSRAYVGQPEWGVVELEPSTPPFKSRPEILNVKTHFQGAYVTSKFYSNAYQAKYGGNGQIPYYGGAFCDFYAVGDGEEVIDQLIALGDTHIMAPWGDGPPGYNEEGQPYGDDQLIKHCLQTADEYRAMIDLIINKGCIPIFIINGEGQDGYQAIKNNFQSTVNELKVGYDRTKYGLFFVAYDGVWPASWSVDQMKEMIPWMRSIIGEDTYLGFMFGDGPGGGPYLFVESESDYSKEWMDGLDLIGQSSSPGIADCPNISNNASYMIKDTNFNPCQPSSQGPFIFLDCSRGPRTWLVFEWATYQTVRDPNQSWKQTIDNGRVLMISIGCTATG